MHILDKLDIVHKNLAYISNVLGDQQQEFEERLDATLAHLRDGNLDAARTALQALFSDFDCIKECVQDKRGGSGLPFRLRGVTPAIRQLDERKIERVLAQRIQEIRQDLKGKAGKQEGDG